MPPGTEGCGVRRVPEVGGCSVPWAWSEGCQCWRGIEGTWGWGSARGGVCLSPLGMGLSPMGPVGCQGGGVWGWHHREGPGALETPWTPLGRGSRCPPSRARGHGAGGCQGCGAGWDWRRQSDMGGCPPGCPAKKTLCDTNTCHNGGTCVHEWDNFSCRCPLGFGGKTCQEGTGKGTGGGGWAQIGGSGVSTLPPTPLVPMSPQRWRPRSVSWAAAGCPGGGWHCPSPCPGTWGSCSAPATPGGCCCGPAPGPPSPSPCRWGQGHGGGRHIGGVGTGGWQGVGGFAMGGVGTGGYCPRVVFTRVGGGAVAIGVLLGGSLVGGFYPWGHWVGCPWGWYHPEGAEGGSAVPGVPPPPQGCGHGGGTDVPLLS